MTDRIRLSADHSIPTIEWAISANAILGIRESGKSSTAKRIAECLMLQNIPIIAIDLAGHWRYLKVKGQGAKGFPVVVVGKGGDLPLDIHTIDDIIRSAIKENISLIIDVFSAGANGWEMVQNLPDILLYENNGQFKHLFIEEAHQIVPEKMHKSRTAMFKRFENLILVGGNSQVGVTLISQRTEQMNKSILENCPNLLLHKQVGKNSLTSFKKAMEFTNPEYQKEIISSLPKLERGECWTIINGEEPKCVKVLPISSYHPDRRKPVKIEANMKQDVTAFVQLLQKTMKEVQQTAHPTPPKASQPTAVTASATRPREIEEMQSRINDLTAQVNQKNEQIMRLNNEIASLHRIVSKVRQTLSPQYETLKTVFEDQVQTGTGAGVPASHPVLDKWLQKLPKREGVILQEIASATNGRTNPELVGLTSYSRETIRLALQALKRYNLIMEAGEKGRYTINTAILT